MSRNIRNFCIIAHIDHGKSTLADRLLELTHTIPEAKMKAQYLDKMDLERERGITIKMQPVRMEYRPQITNYKSQITNKSQNSNLKSQNEGSLKTSNEESHLSARSLMEDTKSEIKSSKFILNLIDTPGHMDFAYEVERSLAAVEGAILLIDATKGIQAQTLANLRLAQKQHLKIIPVLNKMDLPAAQINRAKVQKEIKNLLGEKEILAISAKEGWGIEKVLQKIITDIPAPSGNKNNYYKALVFDSKYNPYKGIIAYVRVFQGSLKKQTKIRLLNAKKDAETIEVGYFVPELMPQASIEAGEIGYIATGLKDSHLVKVGETIIGYEQNIKPEAINPLPGYHEPKPLVFANVFPSDTKSFPQLADSLAKLHLNDASFTFDPTHHAVLGRGFKVGFLGMLHLEIIFERLKREYGTKIILSSPTVVYKAWDNKGKELTIFSAQDLPAPDKIKIIKEPWIDIEVISPIQYSNSIHKLLRHARGEFKETKMLSAEDVVLKYTAPLSEIIEGFLDDLKSVSQGYASFNYQLTEYRPVNLVKLDFAIAGETKPSLAKLVPQEKAEKVARTFLLRLKENLPRQQFSQALQAKIGSQVIAREDIRALKKNVTVSLYGGDYSRKKKLLVKQRKGKKKLLLHAKVKIPEEVYLKILKRK